MKRVAIYAISLLSLSVLLSTCYYVSYQYALNKFNDEATEQSGDIDKISVAKAQDVTAQARTTVSQDAGYTVQTYDMATEELTEEEKNIPNEFIGMNRQQVIDWLNDYVQNKPLDEYNKGLVSWQLVSFSSDQVIVKKTYNSEGIVYKYYMAIENDAVVVYYSDKSTVYDYTEINAEDLSDEQRAELMYGVYVKDEEELYSRLENYTS